MAEDYTGAKTAMGREAVKRSASREIWAAKDKEDLQERLRSIRDQADNEVKRETRGQVPVNESLVESEARQAYNEMKRETRGKAGFKKGGKVKSASARADGCCVRGKTRAKLK